MPAATAEVALLALLLGLAGSATAAVFRKLLEGSWWLLAPVPERLRALVDEGRACDACSASWATGAMTAIAACIWSPTVFVLLPSAVGVAYYLLRTTRGGQPVKPPGRSLLDDSAQ